MTILNPTPKVVFRPFNIGTITINSPLTLAPMAGQTNHAFRKLCRENGGCGLVTTEFISSNALQHKASRRRTLMMFDWRPEESPLAVQLFGSDPAIMADAARMVVDHGADIVDINMGCWVPKIARTGAGAALLRDVCTATAVVKAVVAAVDVPVTVKIRSGWEPENPTAVPFAIAAHDAGVKAIAVHARFALQRHEGRADWDVIRQVKQAVPDLPVIGNGDIHTAADAARMLSSTGCDGVMIGRAALGNPWIFREIMHELRTGQRLPAPTPQTIARMALRHARLTLETTAMPPDAAVRELRGQLLKYLERVPAHLKAIRPELLAAKTLAELEAAFAPVLESTTRRKPA